MINNDIQNAGLSDRKEVVSLLTKTFSTNKSVCWVVGNTKDRIKRIRLLIDYAFRTSINHNGVLKTFDNKAAAIIMYPHSQLYKLRNIFLDLNLGLRGIGLKRISTVLKRESVIKSQHPNQRYLYIWFLGVSKQYRRMHLGTKLLDEINRIADLQNLPVYLETSSQEYISFYEKCGYEVYYEMKDNPDMDFTIWFLRRPAQEK